MMRQNIKPSTHSDCLRSTKENSDYSRATPSAQRHNHKITKAQHWEDYKCSN